MTANPFVGPRSIRVDENLYGRDDDISRLFYLLLADRLVLLYSPSGAGKTSLLNAGLTPRLRDEEDFFVVREIMVGKAVEEGASEANRYLLAAKQAIECALPASRRMESSELVSIPFSKYLERVQQHVEADDKSLVLIFDQFEEVFTRDPADDAAKKEFFTNLGLALRNRSIWAIFAMREEFIARLDEYQTLIPSRLKARQRLPLLSKDRAVEAMEKAADDQNVKFSAARQLAEDLSAMRVQRADGKIEQVQGREVEPLHLQVVCRTLWDMKDEGATEITVDDLKKVPVDRALEKYYESCIDDLVRKGFHEREVREWFTRKLIDEQTSVRKQVMLREDRSGGLDNAAIDLLVKVHHLVRADERGGRTFFELAHDRLVAPIRANNEAHLKDLPVLQRKTLQFQATHDTDLFLRDTELIEAMRWSRQHALTKPEAEFLDQSMASLNPFERKAILWELGGRDPDDVLRGNELALARAIAKQKNVHLTETEHALLRLSKAHHWARSRNVAALVITLLISAYTLYTKREQIQLQLLNGSLEQRLRLQASAKPEDIAALHWIDKTPAAPQLESQTLAQVFDAQLHIVELTKTDPDQQQHRTAIIRYHVKPTENPKLYDALTKELGFQVAKIPSDLPQRTNILNYGRDVPPEEIKLIAYAVIRAGNDLQNISLLKRTTLATNTVNLAFNAQYADETPLSAADIAKLDLAALARTPAHHLGTESVQGTIESYDPATGEGTIVYAEGKLHFRADGSDVTYAPKDEVRFDVYQNARGRYASGVERVHKPSTDVTPAPTPPTDTTATTETQGP